MTGGFRPLVNPSTLVSEVDLNASRAEREELHREIELRAHLRWLLDSTAPGDGLVRITPYEIVDGGERAEAAS